MSSASELYQHEISTDLAGIEGVDNISDDIIVHGSDQTLHDKCLHKTMERLRQHGLTVRLVFIGILLSQQKKEFELYEGGEP